MCFFVYRAKDAGFRKWFKALSTEQKRALSDVQKKRSLKFMSFHNQGALTWNEVVYGEWADRTSVQISDFPLVVEFIGD